MSKQTTQQPDKAGVIIFPPLLFLLTQVLSIFIRYLRPTPILPFQFALSIGISLIAIAIIILLVAVKELLKQKTTVNPSGATTAIVKTGVFQFSRNPMYLSFTIIFIGVSLLLNSWYGMMLIIPLLIIVQKAIIEREEKYLTQKFGDDYVSYKRNVARWIGHKQTK